MFTWVDGGQLKYFFPYFAANLSVASYVNIESDKWILFSHFPIDQLLQTWMGGDNLEGRQAMFQGQLYLITL